MINPALHRNPVPLDRDAHRALRMRRGESDWSFAAGLNACFVNVAEFADAGKDFPIVFVRAGTDPQTQRVEVAPMAVFGLAAGENLFVDGPRWEGGYIPALLRVYPFAVARVDADRYAVCIDRAWAGFSETEGELLFDAATGAPSAHVTEMQKVLELVERETLRTRKACARLIELELLQDMRVDATLRDGQSLTVDGFMAVDEKRLATLPDAAVLELHRSGLLGLITLHMASLGHLRRLIDRRSRRTAHA